MSKFLALVEYLACDVSVKNRAAQTNGNPNRKYLQRGLLLPLFCS